MTFPIPSFFLTVIKISNIIYSNKLLHLISQTSEMSIFSYFTHIPNQKEVIFIYTQILSKYNELETQIQNLKKQIQSLPAGSLCCASNDNRYKWYHYVNGTNTYLPKKQKTLAEQLALKKYLCSLLADLSHEKRALQFYLKHHRTYSDSELVLAHPEFNKLLSSKFVPLSQELAEWSNAKYEHNNNHPENLIHKSYSGNLVRSKSETIIDMSLYVHKIPYRYECALQLGDITIFPDFTLRHPETGTLFYWEHFGQMDNPAYAQSTYSKLQLYTSHGIIPSIHLITTYETKSHPLTSDIVEKTISLYFNN